MGFVDPHCRLHGGAPRRRVGAGEAVRVHFGLQRAAARIEVGAIEGETARQAEQREVVDGEVHVQKREGPAQRARHESAKRHA
jgi:hypothetical protein